VEPELVYPPGPHGRRKRLAFPEDRFLRAMLVSCRLRASALFAQQREEKNLPLAKVLEALLGKNHVEVGLSQGEKGEDEGGHADRN
jgi:hypothetical protein